MAAVYLGEQEAGGEVQRGRAGTSDGLHGQCSTSQQAVRPSQHERMLLFG